MRKSFPAVELTSLRHLPFSGRLKKLFKFAQTLQIIHNLKGIILAGGAGRRRFPLTLVAS